MAHRTPKEQKRGTKQSRAQKSFSPRRGGKKHSVPSGKNQPVRIEAPYPHFRNYKKSGHPALIEGEYSESEYSYRKVMHGQRDGRHLNDEVTPNPKTGDPDPMYIGRRVRHDDKKYFGNPLPWEYPKKKKGE